MNARVAIFSLLMPLLLSGCIGDREEPDVSLGCGDRTPLFSVVMDDGTVWSSSFAGDRGAVLLFFNTGCADCRRELPRVQEVYARCLDMGLPVDFVCVAREESAADISSYWQEHGLTLPYSAQGDREVYSLFATVGIPRLYVVRPDGAISAAYGPDCPPADGELLEAVLSALRCQSADHAGLGVSQ